MAKKYSDGIYTDIRGLIMQGETPTNIAAHVLDMHGVKVPTVTISGIKNDMKTEGLKVPECARGKPKKTADADPVVAPSEARIIEEPKTEAAAVTEAETPQPEPQEPTLATTEEAAAPSDQGNGSAPPSAVAEVLPPPPGISPSAFTLRAEALAANAAEPGASRRRLAVLQVRLDDLLVETRAAARLAALARQFAVPETTIHRAALLGGIVQLETDPAALHQMIARARETA